MKQYQRRKRTLQLQSPNYLPSEITINILTKLPVTSLLRFNIVSKQWNSWISNPESGLSKQRRERSAGAILKGENSFHLINEQLNIQNIENPLRKRRVRSIRFLGSCDGILLISVDDDIFLWNPATRFCTKVIELDYLTNSEYVISAGGLCFDSSKSDYKVLFYVYNVSPRDSDGAYCLVASLKEKKWRRICNDYDVFSARDGIAMHGRLHSRANLRAWDDYFEKYEQFQYDDDNGSEGRSDDDNGSEGRSDDDDGSEDEDWETKWESYRRFDPRNEVICFDAISEEFHSLYKRENAIVDLGVLNDCLCVTCVDLDKSLEILVLTDYEKEDSWKSLFFIRSSQISRPYVFDRSLFMTEDGQVALVVNHDKWSYYDSVVAYDPKINRVKDILKLGDRQESTITYVESLISLKEYYWNKKQHKKDLYKWNCW